MALSGELSRATRRLVAEARAGVYRSPELLLLQPLLALQARWSALPAEDEWLVESIATRAGHGLFFYPFEGRLVASRTRDAVLVPAVARDGADDFSLTANDYGFGLVCPDAAAADAARSRHAAGRAGRRARPRRGLNAAELGRRQFRETARIAGLVFQGYPGQPHPARQLQASSALLYEVFAEYDPDNRLLAQATREVLDRRLEAPRLAATLARLRGAQALCTRPARPTPFAFPLLVEMFRDSMSTEALEARVARMVAELEQAAEGA